MPRVPPIKWGPGRQDQFRDWLQTEITQTSADRQPLERKWADLIVQWKADRPKGDRDFPWPGAPAFEFPLTAIHSDPVISDFYMTLSTPDDYWSTAAKRPDRAAHANPLREFMTALDKKYIRMNEVNARALMDQVVLGTTIYKNHWLHERRRMPFNNKGELAYNKRIVSGPRIGHVPLQHFLIPADAWNIDPDAPVGAARWVAEKFFLTAGQMKQRAKSDGRFLPDYDRAATETVLRYEQDKKDLVDDTISLVDLYQPWDNKRIELHEVHARFDVDNDGVEEDVVAIFHKDTATVLRVTLSPFLHGKRPYHSTVYLPTFGFYGMGIAQIDEWAQYALSMLFEANIHNVLLSNTRAYAAPFGSTLRPGEPMYPGRVVNLQPGEQVGEIRLADIYQSLPQLQQFILQIAQQRSGVTELRQGDLSSLPGRTPATTVMSALAEGKKRFDMILSRTRAVHSEIGTRMLQNVAQFYQDDPDQWTKFCVDALGTEDAMKVIEVLSLPEVSEIEETFGIQVSATSALLNKEAEKQNFIGMMQVVIPMYQQAVQTAMMIEQLPPGSAARESAVATYSAIVELITRLLEKFDIQNSKDYTGNMNAIADMLNPQGESSMMGMPAMPLQPYPMQVPGLDPQIAGVFGL